MNGFVFKDLHFNENGRLQYVLHEGKKVLNDSVLWIINDGENNLTIDDMIKFEYAIRGDFIQLVWKNFKLSVTVVIKEKDGYRFKISVRMLSDYKISKVIFPVFNDMRSICSESDNDYLLLPYQNGWLIKNPIKNIIHLEKKIPFWMGRAGGKYENEYPAAYSFQYFAYYCKDTFGCYLAVEDSEAYIKTVGFYAQDEDNMYFAITNYPENMGQTKEYVTPYTAVLKFYKGDWQQATLIYRQWAVNQKWCSKTNKEKGINPLIEKTDLLRINHTKYALGTRTEEYFETSKILQTRLNCNLALHWYGWNMGEHDVNYPEYISRERISEGWSEKLTAWVDKFSENGIAVIPYVNARLWDTTGPSWDENDVSRSALKDEIGQIYNEPWKHGTLKPICPSTALWHDTVSNFSKYIIDNHFDGLYVDQVGSFNSALCFDKNHSHPLGGGCWWKNDYSGIIKDLREKSGNGKFFTTESCCEAYIDDFDMFLILDTTVEPGAFFKIAGNSCAESVPLFNMIYGEHSISYGSNARFSDNEHLFEFNFIRNIIWGFLPTVEGVDMADIVGEHSENAFRVMKTGVDFYRNNKAFFLYGRIIKIPEIEANDIALGMEDLLYPTVIPSIWLYNNEKYFIGYNMDFSSHTVQIEDKNIEIKPKSFSKVKL